MICLPYSLLFYIMITKLFLHPLQALHKHRTPHVDVLPIAIALECYFIVYAELFEVPRELTHC